MLKGLVFPLVFAVAAVLAGLLCSTTVTVTVTGPPGCCCGCFDCGGNAPPGNTGPNCCCPSTTLPNTLHAHLTSTCPNYNGVTVTLTWQWGGGPNSNCSIGPNPCGWYGTFTYTCLGSPRSVGLHVFCNCGIWTLQGGDGFVVFGTTATSPVCSPLNLSFQGMTVGSNVFPSSCDCGTGQGTLNVIVTL